MKISGLRYHYRLLLLALLFLAGGMFFESRQVKRMHKHLLLEHFQHQVKKRETAMTGMMEVLLRKAEEKRGSFLEMLDAKEQEVLEKDQIALFLFVKDSLVYWSNNTVSIEKTDRPDETRPALVYAGNGWYVTRSIRKDSVKVRGFQLIRREYKYENKYLKPRFFRGAGIGDTYRLSTVPVENGFPVESVEGEFLFSLEPVAVNDPLLLRLLSAISYLAAFIFFFLWMVRYVRMRRKSRGWILLLAFAAFAGIYFLMIKYELPRSVFSLPLFSPYYFAISDLIPSLGVLFVISLFAFSLSYLYWLIVPHREKGERRTTLLRVFGGSLATSFFFLSLVEVMYYLIMNSSISFEPFRILNVTPQSVAGFLSLGMLMMSFLLLTDKVLQVAGRPSAQLVGVMLVAALLSCALSRFLLGYHVRWLGLIVFILFVIALWSRQRSLYAGLILTAFFTGLFAAWFVLDQSFEKEKENMKVLAVSLGAEHDPVAELMIDDISDRISRDPELHYIMRKGAFSSRDVDDVRTYLTLKYFKGYWNKYDLSVYLCNPQDVIMVNDEKEESCSGFFHLLTREIGTPLRDSSFFYLDYQNGQITYFGAFYYPSSVEGDTNGLYIQLDSRLLYEQLGYPELLLDETTSREMMPSPYSYAKYYGGRLVAQNGPYSYPLTDASFLRRCKGDFTFFQENGYSHLIYHENSPVVVVLSLPVRHFRDYLVSFSYLFIFFFLLYLIVFSRSLFRVRIHLRPVLLKQKIMLLSISLLLFTLLLIGAFSIVYNVRQFRTNHYNNLSEKILSVYVEMEHKLSYESRLDREWSSPGYPSLNDLLVKFSNVFYSDINLYDPSGILLATSRPEVFEEKLAGNRMNEEAFYHMSVLQESEFIHKESLGDLEYLSAYMPFLNNQGHLLAYLNLPYFTKQYVLTREISNMIVGIINYMVVLILLTIVLAVIISDKITTPLGIIREKIGRFRLGKDYEHIVYKEKDEIGSLVDAYNRMIDELARNVELLARSERETAWREMAKQVAHEIKNPLTPMKLSVQQLQRARKENKEDFDEMFNKLTGTLIEQIDRLSAIASAFSNFARLPKMKNEPVGLVKLLQDIIYLFRAQHDITFDLQLPDREEVWVFADKDLLESVFTNLIKNATQAIAGRQDGRIEVFFRFPEGGKVVRVYVRDNGEGIPEEIGERLFEPNFTTRSSGMGMGLAIVKKIVEDAGGRVWYETKEGEGTTFVVELFLYMRGHD